MIVITNSATLLQLRAEKCLTILATAFSGTLREMLDSGETSTCFFDKVIHVPMHTKLVFQYPARYTEGLDQERKTENTRSGMNHSEV